jgi:Alpha-glucosidases, family 31 of glycosyl hydrolases
MDGEQMHSLLGVLYQRTMQSATAACGKRTYGQVRSSHALASAYPFVLYSDLYDHRDFIRGLLNSSFCGLLWTPEVRQCSSLKDLVRRLQTVVFSPQACINSWMIPNPPWKQYDYDKNLRGEFLDNWEEVQEMCRNILRLRMSFIPYIYSCFANYHAKGLPPFRALVMDYPEDTDTYDIDDQYIVGDGLLVAPLTAESDSRKVYFPAGDWYCFWTGRKYAGGKSCDFEAELDKIPIFVKAGTILPIAEPVEYVSEETSFDITVNCYGGGDMEFVLYEDDGISFAYKDGIYNQVRLSHRPIGGHKIERFGNYAGRRYNINKWKIITGGNPNV